MNGGFVLELQKMDRQERMFVILQEGAKPLVSATICETSKAILHQKDDNANLVLHA